MFPRSLFLGNLLDKPKACKNSASSQRVLLLPYFACAVGSLVLGRVEWPSVNPRLHQSELTMEAAVTNVTLHFSIHLSMAGKSPQLPLVCSQ